MDEADLLAERKGVMSDGLMIAVGASYYLKE